MKNFSSSSNHRHPPPGGGHKPYHYHNQNNHYVKQRPNFQNNPYYRCYPRPPPPAAAFPNSDILQPPSFTILLLHDSPFSSFSKPNNVDTLISQLDPRPQSFRTHNSRDNPASLYFREWVHTLSAVLYLWRSRLDGDHHFIPKVVSHLLQPSDKDELQQKLKTLFSNHIKGLMEGELVRKWQKKIEGKSDEIAGVSRQMSKRNYSIGGFCDLNDKKKALMAERSMISKRLKEFKGALRSLLGRLEAGEARNEEEEEAVEVFQLDGEFDEKRLHRLILRECRRLEDGIAADEAIVCTQPRKIAAISLAERVKEESMECHDDKWVICYPMFSSAQQFDSRVIYMTDHCLLQHYMRDRNLSGISCIIVDEAHERSLSTDLLLALVKDLLVRRLDLRLVIMSATANAIQLSDYFFGCGIFHVAGRNFPVDIKYVPCATEGTSGSSVVAPYVSDVMRMAAEVHKTEKEGTILAFLTSQMEVEWACENFKAPNAIAVPLHGKLSFEEQFRVFLNHPGKRKVVFATNIAETSLTIPGIKYVIDSGMVKESKFEPGTGMNVLKVCWISKSSANQRAGRAGRTEPGRCYRLYSESDFESMHSNQEPEIRRVHLGVAVLRILALGIKNVQSFDFVDAPSSKAIDMATRNLIQLGAIVQKNGVFELTDEGKYLVKLGIEPRLASLNPPPLFDALKMESRRLEVKAMTGYGSTLLKKFCGKSNHNLRSLISRIRTTCMDERIGVQVNVDQNEILLFASSVDMEKVLTYVNEVLECEVRWLLNECMEKCLYHGSTASPSMALFGAGAEIKHLEVDKRCLAVDIFHSNVNSIEDKELLMFFEKYSNGSICSVHKSQANVQENDEKGKWGKITFLTPDAARKAVELDGVDFAGSALKVFQPEFKDAFMKAWITFDGRLHLEAARALEQLEGKVLPGCLPWQKIKCQQLFYSSVSCSSSVYAVIKRQLDSLIASFRNLKGADCHLEANENGSCRVRISANATKTVAELRRPVEELMNGRTIKHASLTPSVLQHLFSRDGINMMRSLQQETRTYIFFDRHSMNVRIFGSPDDSAVAQQKLIQSLLSYHESKQLEVPLRGPGLPSDLMKEVVNKFGPDLHGLKEKIPGADFTLSTRHHVISICGDKETKRKVEEIVLELAETGKGLAERSNTEVTCPICLCEVEDGYQLEGCSHFFCRLCLLEQCESAIKNLDSFPVFCAHQGCKVPIYLTDLKSLLSTEKLEELFRASLGAFVAASGGTYRFCPSPDCPSVYRVADPESFGEPFVCGACYAETCTRCHLEYHPYLSCEKYREFKEDPDSSLKEWCKGKDQVKTCPVCGYTIEKIEGCNHVECKCGRHVCWVCLEFYSTSDECYGHLRAVHNAFI
ncbi:hypothetical protein COLO4_27299 [Corchorus olitorius]|uniref:RNA helicase n=1 Tax=Corchorus olitorius TaxID=93759 RepID=A0A1R3HS85_9ROSI|nr:hypothetical protein COLO4_27299 [Corchorus olitorius]